MKFMPTLEFFGYSQNEIVKLIDTMKPILANLTFCKDIVFVHSFHEQTKVIGWDGLEHPFIRILTRSKERADLLRERLNSYTDIEVVFIEFYTKR